MSNIYAVECRTVDNYTCPTCGAGKGVECRILLKWTKLLSKKPRALGFCHDARVAKRILCEGS